MCIENSKWEDFSELGNKLFEWNGDKILPLRLQKPNCTELMCALWVSFNWIQWWNETAGMYMPFKIIFYFL